MTQWVNCLRNNIFVNLSPLPLLCEISGALHLAQLGLTAGYIYPSIYYMISLQKCFQAHAVHLDTFMRQADGLSTNYGSILKLHCSQLTNLTTLLLQCYQIFSGVLWRHTF